MTNYSQRTGRLVRPYAITGGRTDGSGIELSLESQVVATDLGRNSIASLRWEASRIVAICHDPTALVEIAALAEVPVGVARVIVADLAADRLLEIYRPVDPATETDSYMDLLEKVLDGIRSL